MNHYTLAIELKPRGAKPHLDRTEPFTAPRARPLQFDEGIRQLQQSMDTCEKLLRTPLPLSYTRHTSRFLIMWLTWLPFVAWDELRWATVAVDVIMVGFRV